MRQQLRQANQRLEGQTADLRAARRELKRLAGQKASQAKSASATRELTGLRRKLQKATDNLEKQDAELKEARSKLKAAMATAHKSLRDQTRAFRVLRTEQARRQKLAQRASKQLRRRTKQPAPIRVTGCGMAAPIYPARPAQLPAVQPQTPTAHPTTKAPSPPVRRIPSTQLGQQAAIANPARVVTQRRSSHAERLREELVEIDAKSAKARETLLLYNLGHGYRLAADELAKLKIQEMLMAHELAVTQDMTGRRVTAQRIPPGTDVNESAALWTIAARLEYNRDPPRRRKTEPFWRKEYWLLDEESEDELQMELAGSLLKLKKQLPR